MRAGNWTLTPNGWARPIEGTTHVMESTGEEVQLFVGHIQGNRVVAFERGEAGFRKVYKRTHFPFASPTTPGMAFVRDETREKAGRVYPWPDTVREAAEQVNQGLRASGVECDDSVPPEPVVSEDPKAGLWRG